MIDDSNINSLVSRFLSPGHTRDALFAAVKALLEDDRGRRMKVLKPGTGQKGWAAEVSCTGKGNGNGGCKAVLLVDESDLFQTYRSSMGRDEEWFATFKCVECGVLTDITNYPKDARSLPKKVST